MRRRVKIGRNGKVEIIPAALADATAKWMLAKRTEIVFGIICTVLGAGAVLLMLFWLLHQVKVSFYL